MYATQPFQSLKPDTFEDSNSTWLNLIDGASNEENVPLGTHFVKARKLDVVVAVDASADDSSLLWPKSVNCTSLLICGLHILFGCPVDRVSSLASNE